MVHVGIESAAFASDMLSEAPKKLQMSGFLFVVGTKK